MNKKSGFTLLEVVIAIVLAAILIPVIVGPMRTILVKGAQLELIVTASRLAEMKLEYLVNLNFDDINDIPETAFDPPMEDYSFIIDMDFVDGPDNLDTVVPLSDYKRVRIDIVRKGQLAFTMTSLITKNVYGL
ncbi:type II secretion system protein [Candidatus Margulisiibacteriota bacterium]